MLAYHRPVLWVATAAVAICVSHAAIAQQPSNADADTHSTQPTPPSGDPAPVPAPSSSTTSAVPAPVPPVSAPIPSVLGPAPDPVPPLATTEQPPFETVVTAPREYTSASSQVVRDRDFLLRPHLRPADILMTVPGMYVIQHAGGGKANQYFLRGFDSDHGTDVAISVDGVPVNAVSHGHGQGYADLHFVIPELVERIEARKGPYSALDGDFATAGSFNLVTKRQVERSSVTAAGGRFATWRGLAITSAEAGGWRTLLAGEIYATDGPFVYGENLKRVNLFGKLTRDIGPGTLSLTLTSYGAGWNASGQIPQRAVAAGTIGRFDSIDPTEGGGSQRHGAVLAYRAVGESSESSLLAYLTSYRLGIYSNFTFFSVDPVNGDQINQTDQRLIAGFRASQRWLGKLRDILFDTTLGIQTRNDQIDTGLFRTVARKRIGSVVDARIAEGTFGLFAHEDIAWTRWLRTVIGLRSDFFGFDVTDRLESFDPDAPRSSGVRKALRTSPKASLVFSAIPRTELFVNFGFGFHSNDARGVIRGDIPATPLTRAMGYEVGLRSSLFNRLDVAAAAFGLDLDSETVWVGDEGTTEARGPTRRLGVEAEVRLRLATWIYADVDGSFVRATFTQNPGNANAVALAPIRVISGGLAVLHPRGFFGRLGLFHIGDRPATEDRFLVARGFTRADAMAGYRRRSFELGIHVQNVLNTNWREAQFANVSRLPAETTAASCGPGTRPVAEGGTFLGCEDIHFTPGVPINVLGSATFMF